MAWSSPTPAGFPPGLAPSSLSGCMSACEACLIACGACVGAAGADGTPAQGPASDAMLCIQLCELALHAMANGAVMTPAACAACARSCEKLARECMLLSQPEYRLCARACYRAARECDKLAAARPHAPRHCVPSRSRSSDAMKRLATVAVR